MESFASYLNEIENPQHKSRVEAVFAWITDQFPNLVPKIAWNQPMYTDHGTFIIGLSISKHHLAVAPERVVITHFSDRIIQSGYEHTKELIRIPWEKPVDYALLEEIIRYNIQDKKDCSSFWRK